MADANKALMMQESARRMKLLGIPDDAITKFEAENVPYCSSVYGYVDSFDDIDIDNIKKIEQDGCIVYAVIHNGPTSTTYLVTSKYKSEWDGEFFPVMTQCFGGFAYVMTAMSYSGFDSGCIYLTGNNGFPRTVSMSELR